MTNPAPPRDAGDAPAGEGEVLWEGLVPGVGRMRRAPLDGLKIDKRPHWQTWVTRGPQHGWEPAVAEETTRANDHLARQLADRERQLAEVTSVYRALESAIFEAHPVDAKYAGARQAFQLQRFIATQRAEKAEAALAAATRERDEARARYDSAAGRATMLDRDNESLKVRLTTALAREGALREALEALRGPVLDADGELRHVDAHMASERLPAADALRAAYGLPPWEQTHPVDDEGNPVCLACAQVIGDGCECSPSQWGDLRRGGEGGGDPTTKETEHNGR